MQQMPLLSEGGHLHPAWQGFFSNLVNYLQTNISQEGFMIPLQSTANIATINAQPTSPVGGMFYDSDLNELKVNINGVLKTVQVL